MPPDSRNCLYARLNSFKNAFDQILATQINSKNIVNKKNRVDIIQLPSSTDLNSCFNDLLHSYVVEFENSYPNITPEEISHKIDPWPIFTGYALKIFYSQRWRGFDEKLFLRLLLAVIFTLVRHYYPNYPFTGIQTLDNYISIWKSPGDMSQGNLKKDVEYLTEQIAANIDE